MDSINPKKLGFLATLNLTQLEEPGYEDLHLQWYKTYRLQRLNGAKINIPSAFSTYEQALTAFATHPYRDRISVNNKGHWDRIYRSSMEQEHLDRAAEIASKDRIKKGHLEFYFKIDRGSRFDDIKVRFVERDGLIIGFEMNFPHFRTDAFKWTSDPEFIGEKVQAYWDPRTNIPELTL